MDCDTCAWEETCLIRKAKGHHLITDCEEYFPDLKIPLILNAGKLWSHRILSLDICRNRKFSFKVHVFHGKFFSLLLSDSSILPLRMAKSNRNMEK